jgi:hypothetical protein
MQSEQAKVPANDLRRSLELRGAEAERLVAEHCPRDRCPKATLLLGEPNFALL